MIEEASLYANLHVETSPVATTASCTDQIATVRDVSLSRGGYEPFIGVNQTEVGSGTISLVNNTETIEPGYWVRVRYSSTNVWAGYVQDVNTTYTFIDGVEYAVKTLVVLDWVAWIAQWSFDSYPEATNWWNRPQDINLLIDSTGANKPILERPSTSPTTTYKFAKLNGQFSVAEVLDLLANSVSNGFWKSTTTSPTGKTSGLDSLVDVNNTSNIPAVPVVALSDGTHTGTPTGLTLYQDVEMAKQTSSVVNSVIVTNIMDNNGENLSTDYPRSDSTSIQTYGARLGQFSTSIIGTQDINLMPHPSFEDAQFEQTTTNFFHSIEQPAKDSTGAWSAYNGVNAMRSYALTSAGTSTALTYDDRINVTAGTVYYSGAYAATTATPNTRARIRVQWYNDANAIIATSYGLYMSLSSYKTWYNLDQSATAPAGAIYARVGVWFDRSTGAAFAATSKQWADGIYFCTTNVTDWFDGDLEDNPDYLYDWLGSPNASQSFQMANALEDMSLNFLVDNKTPQYSPLTVRFNAQANLTATVLVDLYNRIYVWQGAHRWTSVVTGMTHNISINADGTTRWMVDIIVRPSTYTI